MFKSITLHMLHIPIFKDTLIGENSQNGSFDKVITEMNDSQLEKNLLSTINNVELKQERHLCEEISKRYPDDNELITLALKESNGLKF